MLLYVNDSKNNKRRRKRRGENCRRSGPALMPPETWDRDRRNGHGNANGRWRESASSSPFGTGSRNGEFSPRFGAASFDLRRPPGHGKQGAWHAYQEDSSHGYSTPRAGDRFPDDNCFRASAPQGNSRYGRFHRDNRNGFGQKEGKGRSWENNQKYNGPSNTPARPPNMKYVNNQRSVGNSPARPSHPNSDPSAQSSSKDQADKPAHANGSGVNQGIDKVDSLESLDWKPMKWSRSGSLASKGSSFSHSSSPKSTRRESSDMKDDIAVKNISPVQSPAGDVAAADAPSVVSPEETVSRKKARLGWGEGLAKFEKKKVDVPEDLAKIDNTASVGNVESTHSFSSNLLDKSPKIAGFSDCVSPATPSSFTCSSSPGLEETTYGKTADGDSNNFSVTSMALSENETKGTEGSLEKLELNSITNLSSLLNEVLQVDEQFSMDSGLTRSSAFNKLLFWKGDISKALELTETEIDSLEKELKFLNGDITQDVICPVSSNFSPANGKDAHFDGLNGFTRPLPLEVISSEEMIEGHDDIDSPGTATSKLEEPLPTQKPISPCGWNNSYSADNGFVESSQTVSESLFACDNKKITEVTFCQVDDAKAVEDDGVAAMVEHPDVCDTEDDNICDIILASVSAGSLSLVPSAEALNFTKKLLSDSEAKIYRSGLKMPAMILDKDKMASRYLSTNGLVEDPCAVEKERALINPWTTEEKEIFMEKLVTHGKDFRKLASFLDHKTIADCIQFYYKNHKSESFAKIKTLDLKRQAKPLSSDTYMLTSEKKWGKENSSLDVLGDASVIAAQADEAMKTSILTSGKLIKSKTLDGVVEDERGTAAADVLAGIYGSLSSEPMSSCITSSIGPKDTNPEGKHQKPSTPDVTHNLDDGHDGDDTCSAESCGEMDPIDWTDAEKSLFVEAFSSHGKDFLMISQFVSTKTRNQCKVFYSKAQKCLGLETLHSGSCSGGHLESNDTNGSSGSDVEDACVVETETASVGCSDKSGSGSKIDEDFPHVSPDISKPSLTVADQSTSDGNCSPGQLDHKDVDMERQLLSSGDDNLADISEGELKQSADCGSSSLANQGESAGLTGLRVDLSVEAEMDDDVTHNDKPESEGKTQCFEEHYIRKCSHLSSQTNDLASSDTEKACSSGDVKLFGKILRKSSSVDNKATTSTQQYDETTNHYMTSGAKLDYNGTVGLENVPVRNYGIWDGSKIQVVSYPTFTESPSALLLAKYPAAFASRSVSFSQTGQQMVQVPVNSSECNLNNNGNRSFADYSIFRGQNGVPSPFSLNFNQRQNVRPELQRNGFEATSSLQSRANGSVNMGVVQGGDLRGGICAGMMDPVAALQLQYSRQQFGGSSGGGHMLNGIVKESRWGGLGDVGR